MSRRGPDLRVTEVTRPAVASKGEKKQFSDFFITINTNYRPKTNEESFSMGAKLRTVVQKLFQDPEALRSVLDERTDFDRIENVDSNFSIEIGRDPRGRRVHTHIQATITHTTKVFFDKAAVKAFVMANIDDARVKGVLVGIRGQRNANLTRKQYLAKDAKAPEAAAAEAADADAPGEGQVLDAGRAS